MFEINGASATLDGHGYFTVDFTVDADQLTALVNELTDEARS